MWVINDKIYFNCLLCVAVFTTDKIFFPPSQLGKSPGWFNLEESETMAFDGNYVHWLTPFNKK